MAMQFTPLPRKGIHTMRILGRQASPGLALAIAVPLIPCLAYVTSSQPAAPRCASAGCRTIPSAPGTEAPRLPATTLSTGAARTACQQTRRQ